MRTLECILVRTSVLLALLFLLPSVVSAQDPINDDEVVKVRTDLLVFPIRVRDRRGPASAKLTLNDLSLDDPDKVTEGLYLYPGADRLELVFALDQSGSLREVVSQQRDAALALLKQFGERSEVAVIHFAEKPTVVTPFSRDPSLAGSAFEIPVRRNQHTAIFDAAAAAVRVFDSLPRFGSQRRIVILISDGLDNASTNKAATVVESALARQVSFYVIHLPLFEPQDGRLRVRPPAKGFKELAERTGGKYFLVGDAKTALQQAGNTPLNLAPVFQAIEGDLRSQYLLGYYAGSGSRDGREHKFTISLPPGVEYQFGNFNYSRKHRFFVNMPGDGQKAARP